MARIGPRDLFLFWGFGYLQGPRALSRGAVGAFLFPCPSSSSPEAPPPALGTISHSTQRQRSQILTFNQRASGLRALGMPFEIAIWLGCTHIDLITSYIHGQFGGGFFVPQVPPAPRCTPVVISTKLTSRLSLAPCCACQPSFGHIQAAPRRALAPVGSSPGLVIRPVSGTQIAGHG
jgi:hypothetical protein